MLIACFPQATIQRLNLSHPSTTLESLRMRYESFVKLETRLPTSLRFPPSLYLDDHSEQLTSVLQQRPPLDTTSTSDSLKQTVDDEALKLALFGWQAETEHGLKLATCNACFRRLGLWLYVPRENADGSSEEKEAIVSRLNLVEDHRSYCPWINKSSQSGETTSQVGAPERTELAGWEILVKAIENARHTLGDYSDIESSTDIGISSSASTSLDKTERDAQDQERWTKIKKLKQVFRVKRAKGAAKETVFGLRTVG